MKYIEDNVGSLTKTKLIFKPQTLAQAINYAFSVSQYGLRQILTKEPVVVSPEQIVDCTKVVYGRRNYFVLVFRTDSLSYIATRELPANLALPVPEKNLLRFQLDWLRRDWRSAVRTFAFGYYIFGMTLIAFAVLWLASSASLPQATYQTYFYITLSLYSGLFPILFYRFAKKSITATWDLRSLQVQTIIIVLFAGFLIGRSILRYFD